MTTQEFLNIPQIVKSWREVKDSELVRAVFSVMEDESPINKPDACPEKDINVRYGFSLGYAFYEKKLKDLARSPIIFVDPTKRKSSYGTKKKQNNAT